MIPILILSIVSGIAIIIPSMSVIVDSYGTGLSKITFKGYVLLVAVIVLVVLPVYMFNKQKDEEDKKDKQSKIDQNKRDSLLKRNYDSTLLVMKDKFESGNLKTTSVISDNLGKYGFRFDSANERITKLIKDSSKTKVIVGDDPVLQIISLTGVKAIDIISQTKDKISMKIIISSLDATSTDFEITTSSVIEDKNGNYFYTGNYNMLSKKLFISKNGTIEKSLDILTPDYIHFIYFWVRGKYKNSDKTKTFNVDEVYYLNAFSNTSGTMDGETYRKVVNKVKENEKN